MLDLSRGELVALLAGVSGVLILWAVWLAYRLGRDRGMQCRSPRLDRLYSEIDLADTHWTIAIAGQSGDPNHCGHITLRQEGVRIVAEGMDHHSQPWSAEGVVFRQGMHLLFMERRDRGIAVGSIHLRLDADGQSMIGMKSTWQGDDGHGAIETVTWRRSADVAVSPREAATVAISPHDSPVFRPVDRANTEVVAHSTTPV